MKKNLSSFRPDEQKGGSLSFVHEIHKIFKTSNSNVKQWFDLPQWLNHSKFKSFAHLSFYHFYCSSILAFCVLLDTLNS